MTGKHRSARRQLFPEKLWDLVNKPESGVQWSPDGKRIEVQRTELEKTIHTKFRSQNFDSFIRQLHFYGFRKCGNSYHHDKFQRGQPEALLTMKRKYSNLTLPSSAGHSHHKSFSPYYKSSSGSSLGGESIPGSPSTSAIQNLSSQTPIGDSNNNMNLLDEVIDLSNVASTYKALNNTIANKANFADESIASTYNVTPVDGVIDYSRGANRTHRSRHMNRSPSKSLVKPQALCDGDTRTVGLYSARLDSNFSDNESKNPNLCSKLSEVIEYKTEMHTIKDSKMIAIPDAMRDPSCSAWPKTLVFENTRIGNQKIMSAYFLYPN